MLSEKFPPVLILAGGLGTRLGSDAASTPKAMMDINGEPFIAHQLKLLKEQGVSEIVLCLAHLAKQINDYVGNGSRFGLRVRYSYDGEERLGTGGALRKASSMVGDHFAVTYGDTFLNIKYAPVYHAFLASKKPALMTVLKNEDRWDKSNILFADGKVVRYDKVDRAGMKHIDYGLSIVRKTVFDNCPNEAFDFSLVVQNLIRTGDLAGYEVTQRFYAIDTEERLAETRAFIDLINKK